MDLADDRDIRAELAQSPYARPMTGSRTTS